MKPILTKKRKTNHPTEFITNFFTEGSGRSIKVKKNIAASFVYKGLSITIGLILVPLTINYLNPEKYGIWVTLSSIIGWFGFFDIGLGHGLRNKFAEALAKGEHKLARIYVSTTYAILTLIISGVLVIFLIVNKFLNWRSILNASGDEKFEAELGFLAIIVFTFFCISFVLKLITTILIADQRPAKASIFELLGKIIALVVIFILTKTTKGSLIYLGIVMSSAPVIVLLVSSATFFSGKYKIYQPSPKYVDLNKGKDLLNLGVNFFIIQIAAVVLYQTNNIIISHLFGPSEVTPYNVAFKYFSILLLSFSILITPFWSAFTEAWVKKELQWIIKIMRKLKSLWLLLVLIGVIMLICSNWIFDIWVGKKIIIPFTMSAAIAIWVLLNAWNSIYSHFLNGVGKIRLQLIIGVVGAVLNVPLAILLGRRFGVEGIIISNILLGIIAAFILPIQYKKIICNTATSIWDK